MMKNEKSNSWAASHFFIIFFDKEHEIEISLFIINERNWGNAVTIDAGKKIKLAQDQTNIQKCILFELLLQCSHDIFIVHPFSCGISCYIFDFQSIAMQSMQIFFNSFQKILDFIFILCLMLYIFSYRLLSNNFDHKFNRFYNVLRGKREVWR